MSDLFADKMISPMLIGREEEAFDDDHYLFELKWDGERCLAYLDPKAGTELRNKRNDRMLPKVPELEYLHNQVGKPCILDGELMVLVDGKPNFYEIQRRSLMRHPFKISLAAKEHPASFIAFDILYDDGENVMGLDLITRKKLLEKRVKENERIALSRYVEGKGIPFFTLAEREGLEGIVGKEKQSVYTPGKRTTHWCKIKNMEDDDFVVCGYIEKEHSMASLILGKYEEGALCYQGHVTLGVNGAPYQKVRKMTKLSRPDFDVPAGHGNERAVWIVPELVCTVKYMHKTPAGGLRQPVFKGLREDKTAIECTKT